MVGRWRAWVLVLAAAGCHHTPRPAAPRPASPTVVQASAELPLTKPDIPVLDGEGLPALPRRNPTGPEGSAFRRVTDADCLKLAAANTGPANLLDEENRVPPPPDNRGVLAKHKSADPDEARDRLRQTLRYHTALEFRNRSAADALDRFYQLADAEARTDLVRKAFPVIDALTEKAKAAKAADVRFPLDPADLDRQRSQLVGQLEQAELGSRLLNIDLKRRLGLPAAPADERLWPTGEFTIDPAPADEEQAVAAALADRPELRGLRALYHGLTPETLPDARDLLRAAGPLLGLGQPSLSVRLIARVMTRRAGPDPNALAELEVRRKQLFDLIAERERGVADEARAAALALNAQTVRATLARDRVLAWDEKLADAVRKRDAKQPGAELLEPEVRVEWLKAKAELVAEVAAWHQARVRLRAAQGRFAWEMAPSK